MRRLLFAAVAGASLLVALAAGSLAVAKDGKSANARAHLTGYDEVTSISTAARGEFRAKINKGANTIDYTLSYSGIEGGTAVFAHIHFAQRHTNGGVTAFLCGGGGEAACPATAGTVTGTITAAEVLEVAGRGLGAGQMDELIRAIRAGATYVNVHSTPTYPGGEIRGQIRGGGRGGD